MTISADFLEKIFGENLADLTIMDEAPYFIGMMSYRGLTASVIIFNDA